MEFDWNDGILSQVREDELCVMAAFLKIRFLYGISQRSIDSGYGTLRKKVKWIVEELERKGRLQLDLNGTVFMEEKIFKIIMGMVGSKKIARFVYGKGNRCHILYFYRKVEGTFYLLKDGRGICRLGFFKNKEKLLKAFIQKIPGASAKEDGGEWMTLLLMDDRSGYYQTVLDSVWREEDIRSAEDFWTEFCNQLF